MPARLALLETDFHTAVNMRDFAANDIAGLTEYAPDALALPLEAALSLADQQLRGLAEVRSLKFAIVVLTSPDSQGLEGHHRDLLWKAFKVPLFEQLRGWDGRVIARECEVHDGLHFDMGGHSLEADGGYLTLAGMATGIAAEIVLERCECSAETPRLRYRAPVGAVMARAAAA